MTSVSTNRRLGVNASMAVKVPCVVATTADITLSGEQTIDGVAVVDGNRVLVKDQTDASENGIYDADTSSWVRSPDWDGTNDIVKGTYVYVAGGSVGNNYWQVTTANPITIGTSDVALQATDPDSLLRTNLADTANGQGASLIGVEDDAGNFSGATVESVFAEIIADYAAVTNGNGASKIGVEDSGGYYADATVEAILAVIGPMVPTSGTWTPTIQDNSGSDGEGQTYSVQYGSYTKVGNRVSVSGYVTITSLGTLTGSEFATIAGLPFTSSNTANSNGSLHFSLGLSLNISVDQYISAIVEQNDTTATIYKWDDAAGVTALTLTELSAGASLVFAGEYVV